MYIYEKKSLKMTALYVVFNAGSLYEKEGKKGTMHLMEHLVCKRFDDMQDKLLNEGITWNAYTSDEQVVFWARGLDAHFTPEIKKELVDKIIGNFGTELTQESFDNEKKTVLQEYGDAFDDPQSGAYLDLIRAKFNYYSAIGKRADIEAFTYEDAIATKKELFTKPVRIVEVGPTKTDFSYVEYTEERPEHAELKYTKKLEAELEEIPDTDKTMVFAFGTKLVKKADYPFLKVATAMLGHGLNSPLYKEIREKRGLSYYSHAGIETYIDKGLCIFDSCTTNDKAEELMQVYSMFVEDVEKFLTRERFDIVLNALKIEKEKQKIFRYKSCDDLIRKTEVQMPKNLNKITYEKVVEVAKKYINEKVMKITSAK